jgi:FolB domain-containing protein
MDQVFIHNLHLETLIGVYEWERTSPREILANITLFTDIRAAGKSDDLSDCVNYESIAGKVRQLAAASSRFTVEALASDIAEVCLEEPGVEGVRIRLDKPGAVEQAQSVGVEIERFK